MMAVSSPLRVLPAMVCGSCVVSGWGWSVGSGRTPADFAGSQDITVGFRQWVLPLLLRTPIPHEGHTHRRS
jgi:hypothetical protein